MGVVSASRYQLAMRSMSHLQRKLEEWETIEILRPVRSCIRGINDKVIAD
jgi:hypothetical protein